MLTPLFLMLLASGDTGSQKPVAVKAVDHEPIICRTYETTGTRLGRKRVCMRKSDMVRDEFENQKTLEKSMIDVKPRFEGTGQ